MFIRVLIQLQTGPHLAISTSQIKHDFCSSDSQAFYSSGKINTTTHLHGDMLHTDASFARVFGFCSTQTDLLQAQTGLYSRLQDSTPASVGLLLQLQSGLLPTSSDFYSSFIGLTPFSRDFIPRPGHLLQRQSASTPASRKITPAPQSGLYPAESGFSTPAQSGFLLQGQSGLYSRAVRTSPQRHQDFYSSGIQTTPGALGKSTPRHSEIYSRGIRDIYSTAFRTLAANSPPELDRLQKTSNSTDGSKYPWFSLADKLFRKTSTPAIAIASASQPLEDMEKLQDEITSLTQEGNLTTMPERSVLYKTSLSYSPENHQYIPRKSNIPMSTSCLDPPLPMGNESMKQDCTSNINKSPTAAVSISTTSSNPSPVSISFSYAAISSSSPAERISASPTHSYITPRSSTLHFSSTDWKSTSSADPSPPTSVGPSPPTSVDPSPPTSVGASAIIPVGVSPTVSVGPMPTSSGTMTAFSANSSPGLPNDNVSIPSTSLDTGYVTYMMPRSHVYSNFDSTLNWTSTRAAIRNSTPAANKNSNPAANRTSTPAAVRTSTPAAVRTSTPAAVRTSTPATVRTSTPATVRTSTPVCIQNFCSSDVGL
ncbi:hypothetical protein HNY73_018728 [Argiope bruennichi]|uniref:Uncharacterized protein n=1 Tax=Argiope bruennichi TaxID=94029 RepID=A0A8T0EEN9_ARGBR|nr:hypothetical protein HNY73_018728 [Argiope bruennichi]